MNKADQIMLAVKKVAQDIFLDIKVTSFEPTTDPQNKHCGKPVYCADIVSTDIKGPNLLLQSLSDNSKENLAYKTLMALKDHFGDSEGWTFWLADKEPTSKQAVRAMLQQSPLKDFSVAVDVLYENLQDNPKATLFCCPF